MSSAPGHRLLAGVDLLDPDLWRRGVPHELFRQLREEAPVAFHAGRHGVDGFWVVTRWRDLVDASRDTSSFSSRHGAVDLLDHADDELHARRTILEEDPPRHTELRAVVAPPFLPGALRGFEQVVREVTRRALDVVEGEERFDLVSTLAAEVPIRVLARLLGVPDARLGDLVDWGNRMLAAEPDPDAGRYDPEELRLLPFGHPAAIPAFALADELIAARRRSPTDDLLSRMVHGTPGEASLTDAELRTMWLLLVIAGNETTRHTISHGVIALADQPEQFVRWRDDPAVGPQATDEIIRVATAIHWHRRQVASDVELGGELLRAGDKVMLSFASANRDEDVFDAPSEFRPDRSPNPHVSFGRGGPHFCLGAHLARLEVRVVMEELLARTASVRLAGPVERMRSHHINGITRLPVEVHWA